MDTSSNNIKKDFLVELGTEELPPGRISGLVDCFACNIADELKSHSLTYDSIKTYSTPRRLAVLVTNLDTIQPDQTIEFRGPPVKISFDKSGKPTIAAEKFAQKCNLTINQIDKLDIIDDAKGKFLFYKTTKHGKNSLQLLPEIIKTSIKKLPIPKPMRWGDSNKNDHAIFLRPIHWIVMLFGEEIVKTDIFGLKSSNKTFGHRFLYPKPIVIKHPSEYEKLLLNTGYVIADISLRKQKIIEQITSLVKNGSTIITDNLLNEIVDLVEWPVALLGSFDKSFLNIPQEVLITSMQIHQRYFPIVDKHNKLLPNFVVISNIISKDPKKVISGNERVLRARLSDAEYFYNLDSKIPLIEYRDKLKPIIFQEKLGNLYDKTLRLEQLANFIAPQIGANTTDAKRACVLSKCDLVTSMVREFPELQGVMGYYYTLSYENKEVALALKEQYLPRFSGDNLPTTKIGCVLSLADKIDSLVGFFGINKNSSGEKDPFGLRRLAIGIVRIILENGFRLDLNKLCEHAQISYINSSKNLEKDTVNKVIQFIYERLRHIYQDQGKNPNIFNAILANSPKDLLDFTQRFEAVDSFSKSSEASSLIEIYKRIRNILNKSADNITDKICHSQTGFQDVVQVDSGSLGIPLSAHAPAVSHRSLLDINEDGKQGCNKAENQNAKTILDNNIQFFGSDNKPEQAEVDLTEKIKSNSKIILKLYTNEEYSEIFKILIALKPAIDNFFDNVMVMDKCKQKRINRLLLLKELQKLFTLVADLSWLV